MSILYIITSLILLTAFLLIKKTDGKENLLFWLLISIILFMCYNSISVYVLSTLGIKASLIIRSIINIFMSFLFYNFYFKNTHIQKYYVDFKDILACLFILLFCIYVAGSLFGKNIALKFETTDPASHFNLATRFAESNLLLEKSPADPLYGQSKCTMFFSYTNLGTLFQLAPKNISFIILGKIFVLFESFIFLISGLLLYFTITMKRKNNKIGLLTMILSILISILYLFGYPLNNLIFGFHYLGLGVLLINTIIIFVTLIFSKKFITNKLIIILTVIVIFSIFTTYYLFVPVIYASVGIYILWQFYFNKKLNFKKSLLLITYILIIPFIIGFINYFIPPLFDKTIVTGGNALALEGYIYRNLLGNFIFLIPICIWNVIEKFKNKRLNIETIIFALFIIFCILVFFLGWIGKASSYYYFKSYYPISLLMFIIIGNIIDSDSKRSITIVYLLAYVILIIFQINEVDSKISNHNILFNPSGFSRSITDIYAFNYQKINSNEYIYSASELNSLEEIEKIIDDENIKTGEIILYDGLLEKLWFYSYFKISPVNDSYTLSDYYNDNLSVDNLINNSNFSYVLYHHNDNDKTKLLEYFTVLYDDDNFVLAERK